MTIEARSDAELIELVRSGDVPSYGLLYERHREAAEKAGRAITGSRIEGEELAAEGFERVLGAISRGAGPTDSFRAYLYTSMRNLHAEQSKRAQRVNLVDDFTPYEQELSSTPNHERVFDNAVVAQAFGGLSERHQAVLWYLDVEGMTPMQVAPLLGLTPNSTSALAVRARESLRDAYLQGHVSVASPNEACRLPRGKLGAYRRGTLSARDTRKVDEHLESCVECTAVLAELHEVNHGLRAVLLPLVLGGGAVTAWIASSAQPAAAATLGAGAGAAASAGARGATNSRRTVMLTGLAAAASTIGIIAVVAAVSLAGTGIDAVADDAVADVPVQVAAPATPKVADTEVTPPTSVPPTSVPDVPQTPRIPPATPGPIVNNPTSPPPRDAHPDADSRYDPDADRVGERCERPRRQPGRDRVDLGVGH